jgi:hypothetical protein
MVCLVLHTIRENKIRIEVLMIHCLQRLVLLTLLDQNADSSNVLSKPKVSSWVMVPLRSEFGRNCEIDCEELHRTYQKLSGRSHTVIFGNRNGSLTTE